MGNALTGDKGDHRDRFDSKSSDGDGGGYGMRNDRIWSEATSGGGAEYRYGQGGSENARGFSSNQAASPLKKSLLAAEDHVFMTNN